MFEVKPTYQDHPQGGGGPIKEYKEKNGESFIGELRTLSTKSEVSSVIDSGYWAGKTFSEYIEKLGPYVVGENGKVSQDFPILIKLIGTHKNMPIQVHPDDFYGQMQENQMGKSKMWYILEAKEGSFIYYGLKEPITKEGLKIRIETGKIEEVLHKVPVKKGDVFYLPAGIIHSAGDGVVFYEVQENSELVYTLQGNDLTLPKGKEVNEEIRKGLEVCQLVPKQTVDKYETITKENWGSYRPLVDCPYFSTEEYRVETPMILSVDETTFLSIFCYQGEGTLTLEEEKLQLKKGTSIFVPARKGEIKVEGKVEFLIVKSSELS